MVTGCIILTLMGAGIVAWFRYNTPLAEDTVIAPLTNQANTNDDTNVANTNVSNTSNANTNSVNTSSTNTTTTTAETNTATTSDNSDFGACSIESETLCNGLRDGKLALVSCLLDDHYDELSDDCRNSLERRQDLNEELVAACAQDRGTYCRGVKPEPGSEPMVDCLEEHYTELSTDCRAAFDAHDAAKPEDQQAVF